MVVPDRNDESHAASESLGHLAQTSLDFEVVLVSHPALDVVTECVSDGIVVSSVDGHLWGLNGLSVLDVLSSDLYNLSIVSSRVSEELGDDGERLGGVDVEVASWSVEVDVSVSMRGEVTAVLVADTLVSFA